MPVPNTSFAFFNAQVAFYCLLKAFGIGKNDRVLIPGYTNSFIPKTVYHTSAVPEFTDINLQNYNSLLPHYQAAYERIQDAGTASSLAALMIHHAYGSPNPDTEKIVSWAIKKGLKVIEYCSYAPQLSFNGRALGTSGDGSFFTFGFEGVVQINNPKYLNIMAAMEKVAPSPTKTEALAFLANHFSSVLKKRYHCLRRASDFVKKATDFFTAGEWSGAYSEAYPREFFKGNCQIQRQLSTNYANRFDTIILHRSQLAAYYSKLLERYGFPSYDYNEGSILSYYPVRVKNKQSCLSIARSLSLELEEGLDYPPNYTDADTQSSDVARLPGVVSAVREVVCLPLHEQINSAYAEDLVSLLDRTSRGTTYKPETTPKIKLKIPYAASLVKWLDKKVHSPT